MAAIADIAKQMKRDFPAMAASDISDRNQALKNIKDILIAKKADIFAENKKDMDAADENGVAEAVKKRLKFDEHKLDDVTGGLDMLVDLDDPLGKVSINRELDEGLLLKRVSCPIGVIGVIFEARPDALVQIASLCIKSGNCAILKGGKETKNTNRILFELISEAVSKAGLPDGCLKQAESHAEIDELLKCHESVDLIIPRGSNAFVRYIMDNTKIPVMGHADGICHIYVDESFDREIATRVIVDAKIQYTAACNAVETLLINRKIAGEFLPELKKALDAEGVKIRGTKDVTDILAGSGSGEGTETIGEDDFDTEYLALTLGIKLVDGVDEAIDHINIHGSHHTDCIITDDDDRAAKFMQMVDSAGVYQNCSTRFADGFRYGFGAEVGISTGKIHARGPVGLEGLITYKYRLYGHGQTVTDYATGVKKFNHRDV